MAPNIRGRVSDPIAALSGSQPKAPGFAGGYLLAIAKARMWINDLVARRVETLAEIGWQKHMVERHVRLLIPLAFVSPRVVSAIISGIAPKITVTELAIALPLSWTQQCAYPTTRLR